MSKIENVPTQARQTDAALVDSLVDRYREKVERLVSAGLIAEGAVLTNVVSRLEYAAGKEVNWVSCDAQLFVTRTESTETARPMAPVVPAALRKIVIGDERSWKRAEEALHRMFRGFFATLETGVFLASSYPRTLPGIPNKTYAEGRLGEVQKYADSNEKIGL